MISEDSLCTKAGNLLKRCEGHAKAKAGRHNRTRTLSVSSIDKATFV